MRRIDPLTRLGAHPGEMTHGPRYSSEREDLSDLEDLGAASSGFADQDTVGGWDDGGRTQDGRRVRAAPGHAQRPGWQAAMAVPLPVILAAAALAVGAGGWWLWQRLGEAAGPAAVTVTASPAPHPAAATTSAPPPVVAGGTAVAVAAAAPGPPTTPGAAAAATVHVAGAVARPGIVVVAGGGRVVDAVAAAGGAGPDADLSAINLARPLTDGEMIVVPTPGQTVPPVAAGPGGAIGPAPGGSVGLPAPVNVNTADVTVLDGLPRIGPVLAGRIVDWRTSHGPFTTLDDLLSVPGIGQALLEGLRDRATV